MAKVIDAIYEDGVFKPVKKIRLKEKQQVRLQILADDDWQERFDKLLKSIRRKTSAFSPDEIEIDIEEAIRDVRNSKRLSEGRH